MPPVLQDRMPNSYAAWRLECMLPAERPQSPANVQPAPTRVALVAELGPRDGVVDLPSRTGPQVR